jgi:hypothetical protein
MAKSPNRVRYHSEWDGIIGPDGADLRYRGWRLRVYMFLSACGIFAFAIAAGETKDPSAHAIFVWLAWTAVVAQVVLTVAWFWYRSRQYRAAGQFLGTIISANRFPPSNPVGFAKWCERNQVTPPTATPGRAADRPTTY